MKHAHAPSNFACHRSNNTYKVHFLNSKKYSRKKCTLFTH